jgi:hypothetical protein
VRKTVAALAVLSLVFVAVACGGSSTPKATPTAVDETAFAKSMLLTVNDFPSGWTETPSSASGEDPLKKECNLNEDARTGRAETGDFAESEGKPSLSESVLTFANAKDAVAALDQTTATVDCGIKAFNDGKLDSDGIAFSDAASRKLSLNAPGDKSYAYEIDVTGKSSGSDVAVHLVVVYAVVGRIGYSLTAVSTDAPYKAADLEPFAKKAAAKLKQKS